MWNKVVDEIADYYDMDVRISSCFLKTPNKPLLINHYQIKNKKKKT